MFSRFQRLLFSLMFALLAAGVTLFIAQAQEGTNPPVDQEQVNQQGSNNCTTCHTEFQVTWQNGPHGQAGSDPVFLADWESQGKPGACLVCHTTGYDPATASWESDNVSCTACHTDTDGEHPKSTMTVDRSPDLCGRCHSDTRFGWQDWQGSTHYQRGMSCATCHDPHSASLKEIAGPRTDSATKGVSQLCINCHQEASMNFPYTPHSQEGVSCVDCHLEHIESPDRAAHTVPDHSFKASLQTCNKCHAEQMHADAPAVNGTTAPDQTVEPAPVAETVPVTPQPTPVSPVGYASLAGLVGLAAGMVLAPWLERFYRRLVKHNEEGKND